MRISTLFISLAVSCLLMGACTREKTTGEKVEDTIDSAGKKVGKAVDKTEDAASKAKDKVKKAVE
jgi:hypothetical protein